MKRTLLIVCAACIIAALADAQSGSAVFARSGRKLVASVLFSSSTNSVGQSRRVGGFVRVEGDTTWTVVPNENTLAFASGYSQQGGRARYYICGGNGLFRTDDRGASWRILTDWRTMEVLDVAVDPRDERNIYVATPFGIFRSADDGASWYETMRGMKKWFVQDVLFDRVRTNTLYATAEDDLYISHDRGAQWKPLGAGVKEIRSFFQHPAQPSVLCVGTEDEGIRVSENAGRTWKTGKGTEGMTILAIAGSADGAAIFAGGYQTGVITSTDRGRSWTKISDASLACEAIYSILVDPSDPAHLYLGGNGAGIWKSMNGGRQWIQTGLQGMHIMHIGMYP